MSTGLGDAESPNESLGILRHRRVGVFDIARPLAVAVAALVEGEHPVPLREVQTD